MALARSCSQNRDNPGAQVSLSSAGAADVVSGGLSAASELARRFRAPPPKLSASEWT